MHNWTKYNRAKYSKKEEGKLKCPFCEGYYHRLSSHTTQRHNITAYELKKHLGLPNNERLCSKKYIEKMREYNKENYKKVVENNLLKRGIKTRYTKGHSKTYKRRPEHIKRLQKHIKQI